jgi:hypothetical protein
VKIVIYPGIFELRLYNKIMEPRQDDWQGWLPSLSWGMM